MIDNPGVEAKFLKSGLNRGTENAGLAVLLEDPRCQAVSRNLKRRILEDLGVPEAPSQAFDAILTPTPFEPVTAMTLDRVMADLQLVEMKTTRKAISDERLEGFFFGVTESELNLAARLHGRYVFAFVVLNDGNKYGRPFFVLLTLAQLEQRIRSKRTQFQVTLGRGIEDLMVPYGSGPGLLVEVKSPITQVAAGDLGLE